MRGKKKQEAIDEAIIYQSIIAICISMTFNLYSKNWEGDGDGKKHKKRE